MYRKYKVRGRRNKKYRRRYRNVSKYRTNRTRRIAKKALRLAKTANASMTTNLFRFAQGPITLGSANPLSNVNVMWYNLMVISGAYGFGTAARQVFQQNTAALTPQSAYHRGMNLKMVISNDDEPATTGYTVALLRMKSAAKFRLDPVAGGVTGGFQAGIDWTGSPGMTIFNTKLWKPMYVKEWFSGTEINLGSTNAIKKFNIRVKNKCKMWNPAALGGGGTDQWSSAVCAPKVTDQIFLFVSTDGNFSDTDAPTASFNCYHWVQTDN